MKYFTINELCASTTADKLKIDNTPTSRIVKGLTSLVDNVLDPLREAWGKPLTVNSGYRCPKLNKAVGGVSTSHHLNGLAVDITTGNAVDNRRLYQLAIDMKLPFTQLIGKKYNFNWLHIGYDPADSRHQTF